jgi:hypothetical protein
VKRARLETGRKGEPGRTLTNHNGRSEHLSGQSRTLLNGPVRAINARWFSIESGGHPPSMRSCAPRGRGVLGRAVRGACTAQFCL